ncbi:hypothetical protein JTB14_008009 [Gonioctena quinquepunctata]|nr:hypothetical protein JTB14_008009 [Gonioctena quinquepunctata]
MRILQVVFTLHLVTQYRCDAVTNFYEYVQNYMKYIQDYVPPKDNEKLIETSDATIYDYGKYDFIIIGGGSAGSILASRLSEIHEWKVLLLEAGGEQNDFSDVPNFSNYLGNSEMNWGYHTVPQKTCCQGMTNNQCVYPRGKVLGGSGTTNAMMYIRGAHADFDNWVKLGLTGWSYKEVLPFFKMSEHIDIDNVDEGYHGYDGHIHVNHTAPLSITAEALLEAAKEKGLKQLPDYNGKSQLGISRLQFNIKFNKRSNGPHGYLDTIRYKRSNLNITLNAFVTKILSKGKSTYGVEFIQGGKRYIARANLETILSAGSINSPQLLLLSGIGPETELEKLGIKTKNNLPSVGKNLEDHAMFVNLFFRTNLTYPNRTLEENLRRYSKAESPLTNGAGAEQVGFINTKTPGKGDPDVEFISVPPISGSKFDTKILYNVRDDYKKVFEGFSDLTDLNFLLLKLQPKSRGSVTLKSNSAIDFPLIDPRYYSDDGNVDIETTYQGIKFLLSLTETKAFKNMNATLISTYPGCEELRNGKSDREYWYCAIRHISTTIFHPIGTTKMGISPDTSVVNGDCLVHKMEKLRVVDAGVIPELMRGHTNAGTYMIAEKISHVIKKYYGKYKL